MLSENDRSQVAAAGLKHRVSGKMGDVWWAFMLRGALCPWARCERVDLAQVDTGSACPTDWCKYENIDCEINLVSKNF